MTAAEFLKSHHPDPSWSEREWDEYAHMSTLRADEVALQAARERAERIAAHKAATSTPAAAAVRSTT